MLLMLLVGYLRLTAAGPFFSHVLAASSPASCLFLLLLLLDEVLLLLLSLLQS